MNGDGNCARNSESGPLVVDGAVDVLDLGNEEGGARAADEVAGAGNRTVRAEDELDVENAAADVVDVNGDGNGRMDCAVGALVADGAVDSGNVAVCALSFSWWRLPLRLHVPKLSSALLSS